MGLLVGGLGSFAFVGTIVVGALLYVSYKVGQTARVQQENTGKVGDALADGIREGMGEAIRESAAKASGGLAGRAADRGARRPRRGH